MENAHSEFQIAPMASYHLHQDAPVQLLEYGEEEIKGNPADRSSVDVIRRLQSRGNTRKLDLDGEEIKQEDVIH